MHRSDQVSSRVWSVPLYDEVARVVACGRAAHEVLSRAGGLTAQFEPGAMSLYGAFLGAIALERGDARSAGAVLFPALERLEDDRWLYEISRDQSEEHTSELQ